MDHISTTPFGRRPLTLACVANRSAAKACSPEQSTHKWKTFKDICAAKEKLGVSDRTLAVLSALLSFHPETTLAGLHLVVFPSNKQLGLRAHGMAPSTLRRHLACLVDAGLVIRRDSPNGKRYARKNGTAGVQTAFGFDLTPMVARAEEYAELAEEVRQKEMRARLLREQITLCRRDITKMIAAGIEEDVSADWEGIHSTYRSIIERLKTEPEPASVADDLALLAEQLFTLLETHAKKENPGGNESQNEQHIQDSKPDQIDILENAAEERRDQAAIHNFSLSLVLKACPDLEDYARGRVSNWADLFATVSTTVRPMLGITPSAWQAARAAIGDIPAAATVAAILQRAEKIGNAGGYLRELTNRAGKGQFSVRPMLIALLNGARETADGSELQRCSTPILAARSSAASHSGLRVAGGHLAHNADAEALRRYRNLINLTLSPARLSPCPARS